LELARDEHGCDSKELKLVEGNLLLAQVSVNDVHGDKERFRQKIKFYLNYDEPVDQNLSLLARNLTGIL